MEGAVADDLGDVIRLLYSASQGDVSAVKSLLDNGVDVNSSDFDSRTALHVASCEGKKNVVELLVSEGADVNAKDRWGSTPLADAKHYNCDEVARLLEAHGAQMPDTSPMRVSEVPDYEIDRRELILENEGSSHTVAKWRGTKVFVKIIPFDKDYGQDKVKAFINELSLMLKLRHPNVVQFLGAVTQSIPAMLVMEYLPKRDLHTYLKDKGKPLKPTKALKFALDIARGLNYVHEFKPEPVIHSNLNRGGASNLLRHKSGHLKITDFAFTKYVCHDQNFIKTSGRYMAPELFRCSEYNTTVDVFSFALIVQEMMEGTHPFPKLDPEEAAKSYADGKRPPFKIKPRYYPEGLKELIERCWADNPKLRPGFNAICKQLETIRDIYGRDTLKTCMTKIRYSKLCGR